MTQTPADARQMNIGKAVGQQIRNLRKKRGMTRMDLVYHSGLSPETVGKIERADVSPTLLTLIKIAQGLGVPIARILDPADASNSVTLARDVNGNRGPSAAP
jgi:transcriptional regulator with XRE-family HTH domain